MQNSHASLRFAKSAAQTLRSLHPCEEICQNCPVLDERLRKVDEGLLQQGERSETKGVAYA